MLLHYNLGAKQRGSNYEKSDGILTDKSKLSRWKIPMKNRIQNVVARVLDERSEDDPQPS